MSSAQNPTFARRGCDGLAQIGPTRLDVIGARFFAPLDDAAGGGGAATPPASATPPAATPPAGETPPASTPPWGDDASKFDPDKAWKLIENLRTEAADRQKKTDDAIAAAAEKAKKDTLAEFGRLLTGEKAPETDPVKLNQALADLQTSSADTATKLTAAEAAVKAGQVALQVAILAPALGGNVPVLLSNEQFKTSIASVEPTDEAAIKAEITKALQANAALKQPPRQSGTGEHTGPTVQSLEQLLAAAEKAGDAAESIVLKRRIAALKATA